MPRIEVEINAFTDFKYSTVQPTTTCTTTSTSNLPPSTLNRQWAIPLRSSQTMKMVHQTRSNLHATIHLKSSEDSLDRDS